jgi:hypothetical protein
MPEIMLPELEKDCVQAYAEYRKVREVARLAQTAFDQYKKDGFSDEAGIRTSFVAAMEKAGHLRIQLEDVARDYATRLAAWMDWNDAEEKLKRATATLQDALTALARGLPR